MRWEHRGPFGTQLVEGGVRFRLYAPAASRVELLYRDGAEAASRTLVLEQAGEGFFEGTVPDAHCDTRYVYTVDGDPQRLPDPASRFQPDGVHGESLVVDPLAFDWPADERLGPAWPEHVFYELHVGTFTPQGTYRAAQTKLDHLAALGVTAVELMPLADVPGSRNWGYDGVLLYAPSHNYGPPDDLKAFVAAAHAKGFAVYLDVVYNHFGPEGNYLRRYAPNFFTEMQHTPWGPSMNLAVPAVRAFFIENALYWLAEYRFDGLRLDAVHALLDGPERAFLHELAATVEARIDRSIHLVVETDENEVGLLEGDFRAQWNDDAHHAAHVLVTGETDGYYGDFAAEPLRFLGRALTSGFGFQGEASPFRRGHRRGSPSGHLPLASFVTFLQNHDQVGNRPFGDRITALAPESAVRAIVAVLALAPSPPLLFMGEEWATRTPFLFFCDFEPELARKVTEGRRAEFAGFSGFADAAARRQIPDPADPVTFTRSKLRWEELDDPPHRNWLTYYSKLLAVRRTAIAPRAGGVRGVDAAFESVGARGLRARWQLADASLVLEANLAPESEGGFGAAAPGTLLFATHDPTYRGGVAPPWSVRWSLT